MESLAEFIQQRRENAGLSVSGLAKKTNIKQEILEDIESGKSRGDRKGNKDRG